MPTMPNTFILGFQKAMNELIYELMPAYPNEFGILTLPLPRAYMREMKKRGLV